MYLQELWRWIKEGFQSRHAGRMHVTQGVEDDVAIVIVASTAIGLELTSADNYGFSRGARTAMWRGAGCETSRKCFAGEG